jgi:hypothetical protein
MAASCVDTQNVLSAAAKVKRPNWLVRTLSSVEAVAWSYGESGELGGEAGPAYHARL